MSWEHFSKHYLDLPELDFALDVSRIDFSSNYLTEMETAIQSALESMEALEGGAIANPDEERMVGHYWLRNANLAPDPELSQAIEACLEDIHSIANRVHSGELKGADGPFENCLIIGIGGL